MKIIFEADDEFIELIKVHLRISESDLKIASEKKQIELEMEKLKLEREKLEMEDLKTLTPEKRLEKKKTIFS